MSNIDKQALREIAAAAVGAHERLSVMPPDDIFDISLAEGTQLDADITALNALNSAANPTTVLALLDELEAAEKRIAESESLMVPQLPQPAVTHDAATAIRACLDEFPEGVRDIVEECAAIAENACCADKPAPVSVPAAMEIDDDFDSAFEHGKAVGWNAYRAAMLQGAEPVTTAYRLPFEQWLSQQTGTIDVECGCVMTEVFFHWMRVAYEAGNSPVAPDCSANILRRWLAFGRAMQSSGSQLPRHLIAETESMLAAAPQQEVK
ncbi:ead/Ea22-like family protein [Escherichia coli]